TTIWPRHGTGLGLPTFTDSTTGPAIAASTSRSLPAGRCNAGGRRILPLSATASTMALRTQGVEMATWDELTAAPPELAGRAGRAEEVTDRGRKAAVARATGGGEQPEPYHLFRVDVTELVVTGIGDPPDHLEIEVWREGEGLRRVQRR